VSEFPAVTDLRGKSILVAASAALAMSLLGDAPVATLGLSLLATAVLVPIACSVRLRRNLNSLVITGLLWRLLVIGLVARWILPYYAARNSADATYYDIQAGHVAGLIRAGAWSEIHLNMGGDMVSFVTALLYLPFGPTAVGMTFLSGLLGFVGSLCFVGAAAVSLPESRLRGYAIFVLMLPSVVFWSTLFGKDSWVFCGLGISALGIAQWLKHRRWSSFLKTLIGLGVVCAFRPHIALATVLGLALTMLVSRERNAPRSVTKSVTVLLLLVPAMIFMWRGVSDLTRMKEVSQESVVTRVAQQGVATQGGGSGVATTKIEGQQGFISELPAGTVRLLFGPWLWEATSPFMFVAALDNVILLCVLVVKRHNVMDSLRHLRTQPFAFFCVVFTIQLIVMFSTISNLGLSVREKTQITPFLYVLAFSGNRRMVRRQRPTRRIEADAGPSRISESAPLDSEGVAASRI
jgi:hypothetical protein